MNPNIVNMDRFSGKRRDFLSLTARSSALAIAAGLPFGATAAGQPATYTVGRVMDLILKEVPNAPFPDTVDTLKSGTREMNVKGIATTMFPTVEVIRKAIRARANFIICHEPVFYNHRDQKDFAGDNEMIRAKTALLNDNHIALWRLHDYWHAVTPDGIMKGLLDRLEWTTFARDEETIVLPKQSLQRLITDIKLKLKLKGLRFIGEPGETVSKVCLMPGAYGGRIQIEKIQKQKPDVVICGEISEWETGEYIRDLRAMGNKISLVILGHTPSEEPGMKWLQTWLKPRLPGLPVEFIPAGDPYSFA